MSTVTTTIYLHSSKESNESKGRDLGLKGEALDMFLYAGYEVALELEVNKETGAAEIMKVDGRPVGARP